MISLDRARQHLDVGDLTGLFVEVLGWDRSGSRPSPAVTVNGVVYRCRPVAEKSAVVVYACPGIPDVAIRSKIRTGLREHATEHLVVFEDSGQFQFEWTEARATGTTRRVAYTFVPGRSNQALLERLDAIAFDLTAPAPPVVEVTSRLRRGFDVERVTKRFFDEYKKQHTRMERAVIGIPTDDDRRWYTSLLLNRLMFAYFLQKKGFLNNDTNYLRTCFDKLQGRPDRPSFHSFYREFLQELFLQGFGEKPARRTSNVADLIGDIPYVNGGLFLPHEIEQRYDSIDVPDEVFDKLFLLFDQFQWHLDDRPHGDDTTINPDILGHIFEQYINQKEQGAYYTKEDVTGYMVSSTVVPWLITRVETCIGTDRLGLWTRLREDPERYLSASLLHGRHEALPDSTTEGESGFDRADGDGDAVRLPTESWWECVARRERAERQLVALGTGAIMSADEGVTANVNLTHLVLDSIVTEDRADVLGAWWSAISSCTVLDPTCGSGAFLFAALQCLEEIAEAVTARLDAVVSDPEDHPVLRDASQHRNRRYWLRKRIVLGNLYGVDLMQEATEVAKLRLFLSLLAHVDRREDLEPLPDLDFNLRSGNAVVGYADTAAAVADLSTAVSLTLFDGGDTGPTRSAVELAMAEVAEAYEDFVGGQRLDVGTDEHRARKKELEERSTKLRDLLNAALAARRCGNSQKRQEWVATVRPLHWLAEFPHVMLAGGFAILAGNPPYLRLGPRKGAGRSLMNKDAAGRKTELYVIEGFKTVACPDLYAPVMERAAQLTAVDGRYAMVVMLSAAFSKDFESLRDVLAEHFPQRWVSTYAKRPASLFPGVQVRNTIVVASRGGNKKLFTTRCHRWSTPGRQHLFPLLEYAAPGARLAAGRWPCVGDQRMADLYEDLLKRDTILGRSMGTSSGGLFEDESAGLGFKSSAYNFLSVYTDPAPTYDSNGEPVISTGNREILFPSEEARDLAFLLLAGKLGFLWWTMVSDDFNVTQDALATFPVAPAALAGEARSRLLALAPQLRQAMLDSLQHQTTTVAKDGVRRTLHVGRFDLSACRGVTDQADRLVLEAVGVPASWDAVQLAYARVVRGCETQEAETTQGG